MIKSKEKRGNQMKNQKGITLMILVVTIIIMSIIVGSISFSSSSSFKMKGYYDMCADIELLDEKIAIYYVQNKTLPITAETKNIQELIENYTSDNVNYNPNNSGNLQKIDLSKLENLSLSQTDYYIDEVSHTIYSATKTELEGQDYYTTPLSYKEVNLSLYK